MYVSFFTIELVEFTKLLANAEKTIDCFMKTKLAKFAQSLISFLRYSDKGNVPLVWSGSGFKIEDHSDHGVPKERDFST